jgi:hypothetical protein
MAMTKSKIDQKIDQENINERLHQALGQLRKDVTRVEVWATALGSFAKPVPEYEPDEKYRLPKASKKAPK